MSTPTPQGIIPTDVPNDAIRRVCELLTDLSCTIWSMWMLYERHVCLNDLQPATSSRVYTRSLDEWWHEVTSLVDEWRMLGNIPHSSYGNIHTNADDIILPEAFSKQTKYLQQMLVTVGLLRALYDEVPALSRVAPEGMDECFPAPLSEWEAALTPIIKEWEDLAAKYKNTTPTTIAEEAIRILGTQNIVAYWEYPGYISVSVGKGHLAIGTANNDWGMDVNTPDYDNLDLSEYEIARVDLNFIWKDIADRPAEDILPQALAEAIVQSITFIVSLKDHSDKPVAALLLGNP